ncbi:alcohol dehydrogenase 1 [Tanacetum coccineum]
MQLLASSEQIRVSEFVNKTLDGWFEECWYLSLKLALSSVSTTERRCERTEPDFLWKLGSLLCSYLRKLHVLGLKDGKKPNYKYSEYLRSSRVILTNDSMTWPRHHKYDFCATVQNSAIMLYSQDAAVLHLFVNEPEPPVSLLKRNSAPVVTGKPLALIIYLYQNLLDEYGDVLKNKARLVAKGYRRKCEFMNMVYSDGRGKPRLPQRRLFEVVFVSNQMDFFVDPEHPSHSGFKRPPCRSYSLAREKQDQTSFTDADYEDGHDTQRSNSGSAQFLDIGLLAERFATLLPLLGVKQMSPETLKELQDESVSESKGRTVADSIAERLTRPTAYKFKTDCSIIPVWVLEDKALSRCRKTVKEVEEDTSSKLFQIPTDMSMWRLKISPLFPRIPGHEGVGVIESVGKDAKGLKPRDIVMPLYLGECGQCLNCKTGKTNLCHVYPPPFSGLMNDGTSRMTIARIGESIYHFTSCSTWTKYAVADCNYVLKIDPKISYPHASFLPCGFTNGFGATWRETQLSKGSSVVVFGIGTIGLGVIKGAQLAGASKIIGVIVGALEITHGLGVLTTALGCRGVPILVNEALEASKFGIGTVVPIGAGGEASVAINSLILFSDRTLKCTTFGGIRTQSDLPVIINKCLNKMKLYRPCFYYLKKYNLMSLTHEIQLENIQEAFEILKNPDCVKILVNF